MESLVLKVGYSAYFLWWDGLTMPSVLEGATNSSQPGSQARPHREISKELTTNRTNKPQMTNPETTSKTELTAWDAALGTGGFNVWLRQRNAYLGEIFWESSERKGPGTGMIGVAAKESAK